MRVPHLAAIGLAAATLSLASPPATAADLDKQPTYKEAHAHSHASRHVPHVWGLWPGGPDPYEYRYRPVGYYPYYNSKLWVTRAEMRYRYRKPLLIGEYWSSWGYPMKCRDKACKVRAAYRPARPAAYRPTK